MAVKTMTRRCAPELRPDEYDLIATLLRDYANRLDFDSSQRALIAPVRQHREERAKAARFFADTIARTSTETTEYAEDGRVLCVTRFSRPDAPPGRVPSEYTGGNQASDIAIMRDLK